MKITTVRATWLRAPDSRRHAHVSDFGRNDTFNMCLVEIETDTGLVGLARPRRRWAISATTRRWSRSSARRWGPPSWAVTPRDVTAIWELLYSGSRARYATREGRTFPTIGRRGLALSAISGIDIACWDLLGRSVGQPVWRLLGGQYRDRIPAYASGGWRRWARSASR